MEVFCIKYVTNIKRTANFNGQITFHKIVYDSVYLSRKKSVHVWQPSCLPL